MTRIGPVELVIVFIIVVLLFGVGRISKVSGEIGSAIRNFREGLKGPDTTDQKSDNDKPL